MIKGTTQTGFKFSIDPDAVKDMEFIELAADAEENGLLLPKMIEHILGKEQKKKLYDHVRNSKGRVMVEDVSEEIKDIFNAISSEKETKN